MRIVSVDIEHFRGIESLHWSPSPGMNCLIGPGDSTKTSILDAIELCLNPKPYTLADDCDFYNLDTSKPVDIMVTLVDLPTAFLSEERYGMQMRGWNAETLKIEDEPNEGLHYALTLRMTIDASLEARWSLYNDRINAAEKDPPTLRYKDWKLLSVTRLGPYAERHLAWGRSSVLTRVGESNSGYSLQLADAGRAARKAFGDTNQNIFKSVTDRVEILSRKFSVPARGAYAAALDVDGVNITAGGVSLHDDGLPLRMLGSGSSRLIVSALQHEVGHQHISMIDEVEFGLEPHRIARLLKLLKTAPAGEGASQAQIFITTHSPVVICELKAEDIFSVRSSAGVTEVKSISAAVRKLGTAQRHLRGAPEAFLARRIVVGEGRTEQGIVRGLDNCWVERGMDSLAAQGVVAVNGSGKDSAPVIAEHLCDLGYEVLMLLDSDEPPNPAAMARAQAKGAICLQWPGQYSTEERLFIDLPWDGVEVAVKYASGCASTDSILSGINKTLKVMGIDQIGDLALPPWRDEPNFRLALGKTAKEESWFKDITRGEGLGEIIVNHFPPNDVTPFANVISDLRKWIDA
ncbi:AAA family ATPase [Pseudomonas sp.]|uniref:ATP-dependent nuclease n=1 Tax=Pseudomonas sp. TaxID=306 RepID=UPI003262D625